MAEAEAVVTSPAAAAAVRLSASAAASATSAATSPAASVEDFLWCVHSALVASGPLPLAQLPGAYFAHVGHKYVVERFLVVDVADPRAVLKRIPHVVTSFDVDGVAFVKAVQADDATRQELHDVDMAYRRTIAERRARPPSCA